MKERERIVVSGLVALLLLVWLGFVFHRSPRFAGSLLGGMLAVTGAGLMLVPFAYLIIKRVPSLKRAVTGRVPMRTLLAWHIYAGVLGPVLVLLHTGHKFESHLGIALTAMTLIVVVSGFVGRYLMSHLSRELREKRDWLGQLKTAYNNLTVRLREGPTAVGWLSRFRGPFARVFVAGLEIDDAAADSLQVAARAVRVAESIADVEYAIRTHDSFKRAFKLWLKLHIVISLVLYGMLGLHVWAAIHFGLRWFE